MSIRGLLSARPITHAWAAFLSAAALCALASGEARADGFGPFEPHKDKERVFRVLRPGALQTQIHSRTQVEGASTAAVAQFRAAVESAADQLLAMPAVNIPIGGGCAHVMTTVDGHTRDDAIVSGDLHALLIPVERLEIAEGGRCAGEPIPSVSVYLNQPDVLFPYADTNGVGDEYREPRKAFFVLPIAKREGDAFWLEDGTIVLQRSGASMFAPVSTQDYIEDLIRRLNPSGIVMAPGELLTAEQKQMLEQARASLPADQVDQIEQDLREAMRLARDGGAGPGIYTQAGATGTTHDLAGALRARLASFSPAELQAPICLEEDLAMIGPRPDCPDRARVMRFNPAYFNARQPGAVQLVIVRSSGDAPSENEPQYEARQSVYETIDLGALSSLMRGDALVR